MHSTLYGRNAITSIDVSIRAYWVYSALYVRDAITIYVANLLLFDDILTLKGNNVLRESANRGRIYHKESLKVACAVCQRQRRSKRSVFVLMPIYRSRVDGKCSAVCPCRVDKQFVM